MLVAPRSVAGRVCARCWALCAAALVLATIATGRLGIRIRTALAAVATRARCGLAVTLSRVASVGRRRGWGCCRIGRRAGWARRVLPAYSRCRSLALADRAVRVHVLAACLITNQRVLLRCRRRRARCLVLVVRVALVRAVVLVHVFLLRVGLCRCSYVTPHARDLSVYALPSCQVQPRLHVLHGHHPARGDCFRLVALARHGYVGEREVTALEFDAQLVLLHCRAWVLTSRRPRAPCPAR